MLLKQFVPSEFCLSCCGCCRFAEKKTVWAPSRYNLTKFRDCYICSRLNLNSNRCGVYAVRPLDCQLYPFLLVRRSGKLHIGLHKSCRFIDERRPKGEEISGYSEYLKRELGGRSFAAALKRNPRIAADYRENVEILAGLNGLSENVFAPKLKRLTLKDGPLVERYLSRYGNGRMSAYSFPGIFVWSVSFRVLWAMIAGSFCIFYQDRIGMFMVLPPLGEADRDVVFRCFELMSFYNKDSDVGRIENVTEEDSGFYSALGLKVKIKDEEYLCSRESLVSLKGNTFRHKRASCNQFFKRYEAEFTEYTPRMRSGCLKLYKSWAEARRGNGDVIYRQMLDDSGVSFGLALKHYARLGMHGYVVKVKGEIKGCSFGYPLGKDTFCILFEVCDLSFKGMPQFIFREFCRKLSGYKHINIMGSSGLENLRGVKLSYRPPEAIGVYNVYPEFCSPAAAGRH